MPRLFVGVPVPDTLDVSRVTAALPERSRPKVVDPANYHVTLAFLGDTPDDRVGAAREAVRAGVGAAGSKPHAGRVRGVGAFPRPNNARVVWVGVEGTKLDGVATGIRAELERAGFELDDKPFSSHVTLARLKDRVDLSGLVTAHEDADFGEMPVDRAILYASELTPAGPRYTELEVANLPGGDGAPGDGPGATR